MTQDMKRLCAMGLKFCKHYEINHNVDSNVLTLKVWLSPDTFLAFTSLPKFANEGLIMARAYQQSRGTYCPSIRRLLLDKYFGKAARMKSVSHAYALVTIDKVLDVVQTLDTYASSIDKVTMYAMNPEEVI